MSRRKKCCIGNFVLDDQFLVAADYFCLQIIFNYNKKIEIFLESKFITSKKRLVAKKISSHFSFHIHPGLD
jgi:hypothetical protein